MKINGREYRLTERGEMVFDVFSFVAALGCYVALTIVYHACQ